MPGPYDDSVKKLVDANPQDFVSLLLGTGVFVQALPHELKLLHIYTDALFKVLLNGVLVLLHIEFQSDYDPRMLASLAFENESEAEREWLERTFAMLNDTLRNTRAYQKILDEGREEGREEGLKQAHQEMLQEQRQTLLDVILERFPKLMRSVRKQVDALDDPTILRRLIVKMSTVQTAKEAKELLLTVSGDEE